MGADQSTARKPDGSRTAAETWRRVAGLLDQHPAVKQVRLNHEDRTVTVGFYEPPSAEALQGIETAVRGELAGDWNIAIEPNGEFPALHLHRISEGTAEIHRTHPPNEPAVIWKRIRIPRWRNRPFPAPVRRDYRVMLLLAATCGVTALAGFFLKRSGFNIPVTVCFAVAYVTGAWFATQDFWHALKQGRIDIQFLMIAVALGALCIGAATEGATLLFLFSLSNGLEQFANHRTRRAIESLLKTAPKEALVRQDGAWVSMDVELVRPDDELLVKPGELFPVDGIVIEGATSADESALTGEPIPVAKQIGDKVSGGTLNIDGQSVIRANCELEESALSRVLMLIETAQQQKAPAQRFTDSFGRYYTWVALFLSAAVFAVLLFLGHPATHAFYRAMTVLVVASPCALVLSVPATILVAIAAGASRGILFRGGVAVENLGDANVFAFDKTGTLTQGSLLVCRIAAFNERTDDVVLQTAASVSQFSTHPLSRAIVREAQSRNLPLKPISDFLNIPGLGMEASIANERIFVGSRRFMHDRGIVLPPVASTNDAEVWVADKRALGVVYLRDGIRPAAKKVIDFFKRCGVPVTLLTGDRAAPAVFIAGQVGITDVRAELTPQAKLKCIHDWRAAGKKVAMVGDGINDAPGLAAADVSLGMGARGSDAALEQADVILMHDRIDNVEEAFRLSRRARSIIRQNIVISLTVICVLIISALAEKINLTVGVIGHEGSTVVVILNALRLLHGGRATKPAAEA